MNNGALRITLLIVSIFTSNIAMGAETFGRLFTTPAERVNLDNIRRTTRVELLVPEKVDEDQAQEAAPVLPPTVSIQGYVKRNDGKKGTVWVNSIPVQENSNTGDVQVGKLERNSNQVPLSIPATGKRLKLKAGQQYQPETDSVSELKAEANREENEGSE